MMLCSTNVLDRTDSSPGHVCPMDRGWTSLEAWTEEVQVNRTLHLQVCRGARGGNVALGASDAWKTELSTDHIGSTGLFLVKAHKTQTLSSRGSPQWGDFNSWGQAVGPSRQMLLKCGEGWAGVLSGGGSL